MPENQSQCGFMYVCYGYTRPLTSHGLLLKCVCCQNDQRRTLVRGLRRFAGASVALFLDLLFVFTERDLLSSYEIKYLIIRIMLRCPFWQILASIAKDLLFLNTRYRPLYCCCWVKCIVGYLACAETTSSEGSSSPPPPASPGRCEC